LSTDPTSVTTLTTFKSLNGFTAAADSVSKRRIRINGRLVLDQNFMFNNCTFLMKPASAITVQTDKQLKLDTTTVDGCDQMWKGVTIQTGGRIEMNKSILRDAEIGLKFERGSNYYEGIGGTYRTFGLINARIERNGVGLLIDRVPTGNSFTYQYGDITSNSFINGAIFDGTESDLKPCYAGQNGNLCIKKATIGISVSDALLNTGRRVQLK
jgi:hypothetical protein